MLCCDVAPASASVARVVTAGGSGNYISDDALSIWSVQPADADASICHPIASVCHPITSPSDAPAETAANKKPKTEATS